MSFTFYHYINSMFLYLYCFCFAYKNAASKLMYFAVRIENESCNNYRTPARIRVRNEQVGEKVILNKCLQFIIDEDDID